MDIQKLISENNKRIEALYSPYDPEKGIGSPIERFRLNLSSVSHVLLPVAMKDLAVIKEALKYPTVIEYLIEHFGAKELPDKWGRFYKNLAHHRLDHDFEYFCATTIFIEDKLTFRPIPFILRKSQRKVLASFERQRLEGVPIRTILDKARQFGGSTVTQIYMFWIQVRLKKNWHIAVVAHLDDAAKHLRGMYTKAAKYYPAEAGTITLTPYEKSMKNVISKERGGIIGVGSVQNPDQFHSYNYAMIHMSELGRWGETTKVSANELAQALRPTIPDVPLSIIVMESTANGRGNFFHNEWVAATDGKSRYDPVFVPWWEIELYQRPIRDFGEFLKKMDNHAKREYFWSLWQKGATLEGINWYMYTQEAENYSDLQMWRQFPSDANESFSSTGRRVFSPMVTMNAMKYCMPPIHKGQLFAKDRKGKDAFVDIQFNDTGDGELWIWAFPEKSPRISNRYIVILDIGGKSDDADYSTATVIDRSFIMDGGSPEAVASFRAHLDQDLFAWVGAQIAHWYNKALFVVESNSLRTELADSEGDHFLTILDEIAPFYDNLYTRTSPEKVREGAPVMWGFHTNVHTKPLAVNALNAGFRDTTFIERDKRVIDECDQFENKPDGTLGAVAGGHDDLLIGRAIGVYISNKMDIPGLIQPRTKARKRKRTEADL